MPAVGVPSSTFGSEMGREWGVLLMVRTLKGRVYHGTYG